MSSFAFNVLESYYLDNPEEFLNVLNGNSTQSQIYKSLVDQIISDINSYYNPIRSKIVRLDMDGKIIFSNSDAYFGETKQDVKTISSSVRRATSSEILVADGPKKRAFIVKTKIGDYISAIESMFTETPTANDNEFIRAVFNKFNVVLITTTVSWEYFSSRYISTFELIPVSTQEISINDDGIRDSNVWIRQGTTVKWLNNSSKPVSIYSGKTYYDQFVLDPNLELYGKEFKSTVIQPGDSWSYKFVSVGESNWFVYPDILSGTITITKDRLNSNDQFLIVENDNLGKPFSSRVIVVDSWGNVQKSFGEGYLVNPRSAKPLLNNGIIISA